MPIEWNEKQPNYRLPFPYLICNKKDMQISVSFLPDNDNLTRDEIDRLRELTNFTLQVINGEYSGQKGRIIDYENGLFLVLLKEFDKMKDEWLNIDKLKRIKEEDLRICGKNGKLFPIKFRKDL